MCQHPGCQKAFSNSSDRAKHQRTHVDTVSLHSKYRLEHLKMCKGVAGALLNYSSCYLCVSETLRVSGSRLPKTLHRSQFFAKACQITLHQGAAGQEEGEKRHQVRKYLTSDALATLIYQSGQILQHKVNL